MPKSNRPGSHCGAPSAYTLAGPPERMIPRGANSRTRAAVISCRTISQYTCCSRTRRAMSWAYCEPKSRTSTRSAARFCCSIVLAIIALRTRVNQWRVVATAPALYAGAELMQILLTNDDGIYAPGLAAMERALMRLGDVC